MLFKRFHLLLGFLAAVAASCSPPIPNDSTLGGQSSNSNNETEENESVFSGQVVLDWGDFEFERKGMLTQGTFGFTELIAENYWGLFCFENNNPCKRAAGDIRQEIGNNPVAIQGFQLNMTEASGTSFELRAASVTTAEMQFNGSTGAMTFQNKHTRQMVTGQTCDLNAANAVGMQAGVAGSERVLTGIYIYDQGILNTEGTSYNQIHLSAGRVWYSGVKPAPSLEPNLPFAFTFVPTAQAAEADFGKNSFQTSSQTGTKVSPKFALDEEYASSQNIPRWENHVVIGYCIQAEKVAGNVTSPGFLLSKSRSYRPKLKIRSSSQSPQ